MVGLRDAKPGEEGGGAKRCQAWGESGGAKSLGGGWWD